MKRLITLITAFTAALTIAVPASAAHDDNPSERVASYTYAIGDLNDSGVDGTIRIQALPDGKVQVKIRATGLAPNLPHAQHLHGAIGTATACPTDAAAGADGVVTTLDGVPFYGSIQASLTTTGDTSASSALALDRFPVTDEDGNLSYTRTFDLGSDAAFDALGTFQYVVHGIDFDGNGAYAFGDVDPADRGSSLNPAIPLEATVPAGCAGIDN